MTCATAAATVQMSRSCVLKWAQSRGFVCTSDSNWPVWFCFRPQDCSCSCSSRFGSFLSAAVGDRPQFCRSLSSRQDQHRVDPAPAAGPADPHGEPQLHPAGSPAGARGRWEDTSLWCLQQNHPVRLHDRIYSWNTSE